MWPFCTHHIISYCHSHFYDTSLSLPLINLLIFDGVTVASHPINGMCTYTWQYPETWRKSVKEAVAQQPCSKKSDTVKFLYKQLHKLKGGKK